MGTLRRVLVVDDEENIRLVLETLLAKKGYEVRTAIHAERALEVAVEWTPDFVLTDVRMPGMSGTDLCRELRSRMPQVCVIVMSAYGSVEQALEAVRGGAYDYVAKPFKHDEILFALAKAEEHETLLRENRALKDAARGSEGFSELLGQSSAIQQVFRLISKVADYRTTVLIQGESGTGKELVARALHKRSSRRDKAFVAINCGAIPDTLMESELFGHKRGAFTDAHADKPGIFQEASGGTLFLDEVGELTLTLQVKLLRVLQEGVVRPLGGGKDVTVDVRVIAASVRDLTKEVAEGRFREDLFYRLNVLQIVVPPLRDRIEDVSLLIDHFIVRNNARLGTRIRGIDPRAKKLLLGHSWPGNVRELENLIERAVVLSESDVLMPEDIPERIHAPADAVAQVLASGEVSIKRATRVIEEALIKRALDKTRGNRTAAARLLEISHRALLYKIKEYGLS
ncbi:MAG TPA: sigma-54 dependent transcriptional regulator [Polyangiales bacterium]|nr:sigma-54 dependent transcriptional regulator [Polyangiales bacterium]